MAQSGMLSNLFGIPALDPAAQKEEERLRALAAMKPSEALAYTAYSGGAQAGRGLGTALAGLTGRDVRAPAAKRTDAIEAAKAQVSQLGFDPEDPKSVDAFYKQVIQILQKQGLAGEALDVAKEWSAQKNDAEKNAIALGESKRKDADSLRKATQAEERNKILRANGAPELIKLIEAVESFDPVLQAPQRKMRLDALNAVLESKKKGVFLEDAGDRIIVRNRAGGEKIAVDEKGAVPMNEKAATDAERKEDAQATAYRNAMSTLQQYYDAAVRLHNHGGLEEITGRRGLLISDPSEGGEGIVSKGAKLATSAAGRDAWAIWKQVTGGAFVAALDELKRNSPTGSTGLGQTSNIEGAKVQAAKGALSREPDVADVRKNLRIYIKTLETAAKNLAAAAPIDKITPIPLSLKPFTAPGGRTSERVPAATAPVPASDTVKIKLPDGRTGSIPRSGLAEAVAAGAVEVK